METVRFHDPRGKSSTPVESYALSVDPAAEGSTIALLANGFPDSVNFLDAVEAVLAEQLPNAAFTRFNKGNASAVVTPEMLADATTADAVVAAYGH